MRRGIAAMVVLTLAAWLAPAAGADGYVPEEPTFRPSLGWICWPDRVLGDFDGDGRVEPAVRWNRSGPHRVCDEREPERRWHVTLILGNGVRVQRPLPCEGPYFCDLAAGDLDLDGRDELFALTCCGASFVEWRVYRLPGTELRPPVLVGPGGSRLQAGELILPIASNSTTRDGFGCRTHADGVRVLVVYAGRRLDSGRWRIERARFRLEDGLVHLVGVRAFRVDPRGGRPHGPRVEACPSVT